MLRSVTLGLVLSVLAAACALVEPPVPASTHAVANLADDVTFVLQGEVRNMRAKPVELTVTTPAGALPNAVLPASLPAHTTAKVTFQIPLTEDWSIAVDDDPVMVNTQVSSEIFREGCTFGIELAADGAVRYGCDLFL